MSASFRLGCICISSTGIDVLFSSMVSTAEAIFRGRVCLRKDTMCSLAAERNVLILYWHHFFCLVDMRGFMTAHGQPDQPRSARYVLKDYVSVSSSYIRERWTEVFTGAWRVTIKWITFFWIKLVYIKICFKSGYFYVLNKWNHHLFKADRISSGSKTILFSWTSIYVLEDCSSECCGTACLYSTCWQLSVEY